MRLRRTKTLGDVPLFARCSRRQLADVARIAHEKRYPAGETLTEEGQREGSFFVLLEGAADVHAGGAKLRSLRSGDFFGEIAVVAHGPRTATVTTTEPSRLLVVPERAFRALLGRQPDVQLKVLEALADRAAAV